MTGATLDWLLDVTLVGYTRIGFALRSRDWQPLPSMAGRTVVVSGATSGLGLATAEALAGLGARVCLVGRNAEKAERARAAVLQHAPGAEVLVELADLGSMAETRALADRLLERLDAIHVLVNNAGVLPDRRIVTDEGHELTFATNLLGHFLLTSLLLPRLRASAPSRIVNVSSGGMYGQRIRVDDLEYAREPFDGVKAYARTKRGQVILTELWAEKLEGSGVTVHAMHPGWADTPGVAQQLPRFYRVTKPLLRTPAQGADTIVWLSAAEPPKRASGRFWHDRLQRPVHRMERTRETVAERTRLWDELSSLAQAASPTAGADGDAKRRAMASSR